MKVSINMGSGNFQIGFRGEVAEDAVADLVNKGLKYELERSGLSKAYISLCGVTGKRGGLVLPPKFDRKADCVWSEDNGAAMATAIESAMEKLGTFTVKVEEYVEGEKELGRKKATELYAKFEAQGKLNLLALSVEYKGDVEDEWAFVEVVHARLFAK